MNPSRTGSHLSPAAGAGDAVDMAFPSNFVGLEAEPVMPQGGMVMAGSRKRGAEWMEGPTVVEAPQRSLTGLRETSGDHTSQQAVPEVAQGRPRKRLWRKQRDSLWWEELDSSPRYPPEEFKRMFRMSQRTFHMLCVELTPAVFKEDTQMRKAIPVRKRVAVCIWRLASGESLRLVAERFALGIATCHKICLQVCDAITNLLVPKVVLWPEGPLATTAAAQFEAAYGIPNVVGAVYTTHFPIIKPQSNVVNYFNCRLPQRTKEERSYSVTVQAVVNASGFFTDICIGYPGSMSDEAVLSMSFLTKHRGETGMIQAQGKWLLGGASYPVTDWMLAPYAGSNLTWVQREFNDRVAGVIGMAKDAFMRLKARWSLLQSRNDMKIDDLNITLMACCVLHNICEINGDTLDPDLAFDDVDDEISMLPKEPVLSAAAAQARDHIANMFFNHGDGAVMPLQSSQVRLFL